MCLSARIHLILKYTIQNHIFADGRLLEEARHYKYSEETVTDSNGNARIPFNLTGVIATIRLPVYNRKNILREEDLEP